MDSFHPPTALRWVWMSAPVAALAALLVALVAAGGAPQPVPAGLPDGGPVAAWGAPVMRLVFDLAAVATIGALATAALIPAGGRLAEPAWRAVRFATWSSLTWSISAGVLGLFTVSEVLGVPPVDVVGSGLWREYVWAMPQVRGLVVSAALGLVLVAYSRSIARPRGVVALLLVAVAGLLAVLFEGHSAASADHDLATSSLVVHVVAASLWVGGLFGVLWFLRRSPTQLVATLPRYSTLALVCFAGVAGSGVLNAWIRTSGDLLVWAGSGYGALLLLKVTALVALGVVGWRHRRRTLPALAQRRRGAFTRLAVVELTVMAATVAVAVALSRTPPPEGVANAVPSHGTGHATLGDDVAPFDLARLVTEWRPDAAWLTLVAVGVFAYLCGVRRLRRRGESWAGMRLAAALAAAVVAIVSTSGGLAAYSTATFSAQVAQFLALFLAVPVLLCLSAPVRLAVGALELWDEQTGRPTGAAATLLASRPVAWVTDPFNALLVATLSLFALYSTPLLELSLRSVAVHLAVNVLTVVIGVLCWWSILGVDPSARARASNHGRWALLGFAVLLAGVAARIYFSDVLLAGAWFSELNWAWADEAAEQRRGAVLMWTAAVLLVPLLLTARHTSRPHAESAQPLPGEPEG